MRRKTLGLFGLYGFVLTAWGIAHYTTETMTVAATDIWGFAEVNVGALIMVSCIGFEQVLSRFDRLLDALEEIARAEGWARLYGPEADK